MNLLGEISRHWGIFFVTNPASVPPLERIIFTHTHSFIKMDMIYYQAFVEKRSGGEEKIPRAWCSLAGGTGFSDTTKRREGWYESQGVCTLKRRSSCAVHMSTNSVPGFYIYYVSTQRHRQKRF